MHHLCSLVSTIGTRNNQAITIDKIYKIHIKNRLLSILILGYYLFITVIEPLNFSPNLSFTGKTVVFELVLSSAVLTYFVALILIYLVAHSFGIGREQQPN